MPYTVSHAAAVLPLKNSGLPLAALMIGSMSPDFAYFLPEPLSRTTTHSLAGIFSFCLPVGLLAWQFFVRILERPTLELLPEAWRDRLPRSERGLSLRAITLAALAVIIGAATHIVWDAFTHANTFVTHVLASLRIEAFTLGGRPVHVYFILQVLSSVVGLVALGAWAWNLRRRPVCSPAGHGTRASLSGRVRLTALVAMLTTSGTTSVAYYAIYSDSLLEHRIFQFLIGGMLGWLLAWSVIAVLVSRMLRSETALPANARPLLKRR